MLPIEHGPRRRIQLIEQPHLKPVKVNCTLLVSYGHGFCNRYIGALTIVLDDIVKREQ
jgi:hypothetical protein